MLTLSRSISRPLLFKFVLAAASAAVLLTTGCGLGGSAPAGEGLGHAAGGLGGVAHGGRQPVSGANVYAFAAGKNGYGSAAKLLASTTTATDGGGSFGFAPGTITCPDSNDPNFSDTLYIVAAGGQPTTGVTNTESVLLAVLGDCATTVATQPFIVINEVTTFASMTAMQQFFNPSTSTGSIAGGTAENFGTSTGNTTGMAIAAKTVQNLVDLGHGTAITAAIPHPAVAGYSGTSVVNATTNSGGGIGALFTATSLDGAKLNLGANVLASCVNSDGTTVCSTLFGLLSSTTIGDTLQAAYYMASNPTSTVSGTSKIGTVMNNAPANSPFSPATTVSVTSFPNDWTLAIQHTSSSYNLFGTSKAFLFSTPEFIEVDGDNNIWWANVNSSASTFGSITQMDPYGVPLRQALMGPSATEVMTIHSLAIDPSSNVYVGNYGPSATAGTTISKAAYCTIPCADAATVAGTDYTVGARPGALAVDGAGNVFFATANGSAGAGDFEELSSGGTTTHYATGLTYAYFGGITIDSNYNIFVGSGSTSTKNIYEFANGAYGTALSFTGSAVTDPTGVISDASNNILFTNSVAQGSIGTIAVGTSAGANVNGTTYGGGGASTPEKVALDGAGNLWAANFVTSATGGVAEFTPAGVALSQDTLGATAKVGFGSVTGALLTARPYGETENLAIDGSGNVWVGAFNNVVTEIVGAAAPTIAPLSAQLPPFAGGSNHRGTKPKAALQFAPLPAGQETVGQPFSYTATLGVNPISTTGTFSLVYNGTSICSAAGTYNSGDSITCNASATSFTAGTYIVLGVYSGDGNYGSVSAPISFVVSP